MKNPSGKLCFLSFVDFLQCSSLIETGKSARMYSRTRPRRISERFVRIIGGFLYVCSRVKIATFGALERVNRNLEGLLNG
jgi:hypothetical protein